LTPGPAAAAAPAPQAPAPQSAGRAGYCTAADQNAVTVVIDYQGLGGNIEIYCASDLPAGRGQHRGINALQAVGIAVEGTIHDGPGFLCRIQGRPAPGERIPMAADPSYTENCNLTPPAAAYWSYWWAAPGGSWVYSNWGVMNRDVEFGGFEGWSFSIDGNFSTAAAPRVAPVMPAPEPVEPAQPPAVPPADPPADPPAGSGGGGQSGTSNANPGGAGSHPGNSGGSPGTSVGGSNGSGGADGASGQDGAGSSDPTDPDEPVAVSTTAPDEPAANAVPVGAAASAGASAPLSARSESEAGRAAPENSRAPVIAAIAAITLLGGGAAAVVVTRRRRLR
jgi:hypothetical protein